MGYKKTPKYFSFCRDIFKIKMISIVSYVSPEAKSQALSCPQIVSGSSSFYPFSSPSQDFSSAFGHLLDEHHFKHQLYITGVIHIVERQ